MKASDVRKGNVRDALFFGYWFSACTRVLLAEFSGVANLLYARREEFPF
jgi:hypothetical protein